MTRATLFLVRVGVGLALLAAATLATGVARAEPPNSKAHPLYVLPIVTDDADDQADALTQALRSRTRQAQGWSLADTGESFGMLSIALKCPQKPDAPCLQRIGDQLHADHYMWGTMARKKPNQVSVDMHLWTRGKGDQDTVEAYTDNLKDASDETLRQIAARLFGKLTGSGASGTLVVHAGTGGGTVLVDGAPKASLEGGIARVDVADGQHMIAVRVPGFDAPAQPAAVTAGAEQELTFNLATASGPVETHAPFPTRKVLAYSALVAGAGFLVAGGVEALAWVNDSNKSNDDRANVPSNITDVCADEVNASAQDACRRSKDAVTVSTLGWVFAGVGAVLAGTGAYLLVTDPGTSTEPAAQPAAARTKPRLDVLPSVGTRGGTVDLRLTF
jgi:hypothetical protein